jgi:hypothetical protein
MAVFFRKEVREHPRKKAQKEGVKNIKKKRSPRIPGLAVTPSGKGRGNGKKLIWEGGALREKGAKG